MELNKTYCGNLIDVLETLPEESIDCCITSPPYYGARNYKTGGVIWGPKECIKTTEEDSFNETECICDDEECTCNEGYLDTPKYMGDDSHIIGPDGFCSYCNQGVWFGELGQEPTIDLYVSHLCDCFDYVADILKPTGSLWVVINDSYAGSNGNTGNYKPGPNSILSATAMSNYFGSSTKSLSSKVKGVRNKSMCMVPERFAIEMINRGWILRNKIIWHKKSCKPDSSKDKFCNDFEFIYFFTKNPKYYFNMQYEPFAESTLKQINTKYIGQATKDYEGAKAEDPSDLKRRIIDNMDPEKGRHMRTVWTINNKKNVKASNHFAVFCPELIERILKSSCPENGSVIDPFFGSGTTGEAAKNLGMNYIGIDCKQEYVDMAKERLGEK